MRATRCECVSCHSELGCVGRTCSNLNVPVAYCDFCGDEGAVYVVDGKDLCEECAKEYLCDTFYGLTICEQAEAVDVDLEKIFFD